MKTKSAIIFDWDLTLWNSWDLHIWLLKYTADVLQVVPPEPNVVADAYGTPFLTHLEHVLTLPIDRILPVYMGMYHALVQQKGHLYDGVLATIGVLSDQGLTMAILSDKRQVFGELEVDISGIQNHFQYISFLNSGREYKPSPSRLYEVCDILGLTSGQVLYVGDSVSDLQCAKSAGIAFGAAMWASLNANGLRSESEYVFQQPADILDSMIHS